MAKLVWKIDEGNEVQLQRGAFGKNRILLNGEEVAAPKVKGRTVIPFSLNNGTGAELTVTPDSLGLQPDRELRVDGRVVLSETEKRKITCRQCGRDARPDDRFCEKCGAEIPGAEIQRKLIKLKEARKTIVYVAFMFILFGGLMSLVQYGQSQDALKKLAPYQDSQVLVKPIAGRQYTVGELRREVRREPLDTLAVNILLAVIMAALYLYSRKSPLAAILMALGVYGSVIVLDAILDPVTIVQGILVKILVIGFLLAGTRSALELRKAGL